MTIVSPHAIITWEQETLLQGYFIHCMPAALRSCCFYTGSSAALAQIVMQGRKYLQFTNEEAGSQTLRKMNFFDDKIKRTGSEIILIGQDISTDFLKIENILRIIDD